MDGIDIDPTHSQLRSVTLNLIIGSIFDEFTIVIFDFILVVFLSSVSPESLLLVSIYGLTNSLLLFFSGGEWQQSKLSLKYRCNSGLCHRFITRYVSTNISLTIFTQQEHLDDMLMQE